MAEEQRSDPGQTGRQVKNIPELSDSRLGSIPPPTRGTPLQASPTEALRLQAGTQVRVRQFELIGYQPLDSASLQAELVPFTGRMPSLTELQAASAKVAEAYAPPPATAGRDRGPGPTQGNKPGGFGQIPQ